MESKKDLALIPTPNLTSHWELIQRQCKAFLESKFLPNHIQTLAQAITIAWKGHELGIPPLQAFSSIQVIGGKPVLSAELMVALIYRRVKGAMVTFITPVEKQNKECTVEMQRPQGKSMQFRFTLEDAKAAGLVRGGSPWEKYPAAMLRARAVSAGARAVFPDAVMGCYTPEELGADTVIEGEFIEAKSIPGQLGSPEDIAQAAKENGYGNETDFDPIPIHPERIPTASQSPHHPDSGRKG